ncbi:MAG: class I SAM-dependent methyltransferase [Schleiferiaceae bacterium]|nr:class I SAM-dependent methyltransferase [Schleiferiaceae bacterium]
MIKTTTKETLDAKSEAQRLSFAPVVFQTIHCLIKFNVLEVLHANRKQGIGKDGLLQEVNISDYGLGVLLEMGLLADIVKFEDDKYHLTKVGYFLLKDPMTKANFDFVRDVCYQGLFYLDDSIEKGKPEGLKVFGEWPTIYEGLSQLPPKIQDSWFKFDHFYSDDSFRDALKIVFENGPKHILDVGGNTGKFTRKCCEYDSNVQVSILDLPGQLKMAAENIEEWGYTKRVNFVPTNVLSPELPFPNGDAIWMSQFLDCFSKEQVVSILSHAKKSMTKATDLYIMETFWDNQEFDAAGFSVAATSLYFTAMANGNSKMYGLEEFEQLVEDAGLEVVKRHAIVGISHTILHCKLA